MMVRMTKLAVAVFSCCPMSVACSNGSRISRYILHDVAIICSDGRCVKLMVSNSPCLLHCQSQLLIHLMQCCMTGLCCHTLALYCQHCVDPWTVCMRALQISWSSWQWNTKIRAHMSSRPNVQCDAHTLRTVQLVDARLQPWITGHASLITLLPTCHGVNTLWHCVKLKLWKYNVLL